MPKVNISFNLPEENDDYRLATRGKDYLMAITDICAYLRHQVKYAQEPHTIHEANDAIWAILREYQIDPYEE